MMEKGNLFDIKHPLAAKLMHLGRYCQQTRGDGGVGAGEGAGGGGGETYTQMETESGETDRQR